MNILLVIYLIIFILHLVLGLFTYKRYPTQNSRENTFSLIIVAHNEASMIKPLLDSIEKISYPKDKIEVILVDDHSTDRTHEIMIQFSQNNPHVKVIQPNIKYHNYKAKKAGLQTALDIAKNDIILFTDADTLVPADWVSSFNKLFTPNTGLVIGNISASNMKNLLRYKRIISNAIFATMAGLGFPFSCSGANLAVRRQSLLDVCGYSKIKDFPSGDDKQVLNLIKRTDYQISYNVDGKVYERNRNLSFEKKYHQAKRHYGKLSLSSPLFRIGFLLITCYYLSFPFLMFFNLNFLLIFIVSNLSYFLLTSIKLKESIKFSDLVISAIYPFYMLFFTLVGSFGVAKWKK